MNRPRIVVERKRRGNGDPIQEHETGNRYMYCEAAGQTTFCWCHRSMSDALSNGQAVVRYRT